MDKKYLVIAIALIIVIVMVSLIYTYFNSNSTSFHGSLIYPPKPAADFTLTSQNQSSVSLSDFRGKYVLLFFGFTNCTEECPLTMGYLKQMHDRLGSQADMT